MEIIFPSSLTAAGRRRGTSLRVLVERLLGQRLPQQAYRSNLDVLSLWQKYGSARQELRTRPKV